MEVHFRPLGGDFLKKDSRPELVTILVTTDWAESRNSLICQLAVDFGAHPEKPNVLSPIRPFQMLQIEGTG
jgi:hypothetical protein